jgi:hypothetical protein
MTDRGSRARTVRWVMRTMFAGRTLTRAWTSRARTLQRKQMD